MAPGITIKPMGGLGNQLFQYAVGRKAAVSHGVPLYADLRHFSDSSLRDYQLGSFSSLITTRQVGLAEDLRNKFVSVIDAARTEASHAREPLFLGFARERAHRYNSRFFDLPQHVTLRGYFQSWKYLVGQASDLASEIQKITRPTVWFRSQTMVLGDLGPFIGLHIRLGDYLLDSNFGHLTNHYYESALERLGFDTNKKVVVFSDEPSRAAAMPFIARLGKNRVVFVDTPAESTPIESLNLMALARDMIISNSTFGWWGAWLGPHHNGGSVIAPTPWLKLTEFSDDDLIPPTWISLPASPQTTSPR